MTTEKQPAVRSLLVCLASERGLRRIAMWTLMLSAIVLALLSMWICISGVPNVRGVELNTVYTIVKALSGLPLYTDPAQPPFDITQYSPLYYVLWLGLARSMRLTAHDAATVLALGRLMSAACALAGFVFVGGMLRSAGCRPRTIAAAIAFGGIAVTPWYVLARPDALMFALGMAASASAVAARPDSSRERLWLAFVAGISSGIACLAKQNGPQFVAVVLVFFVAAKAIRSTFVAAVGAGLAGGLGALISLHLWPHLIPNMIGGIDNGVSVENVFEKTYLGFFSNFAFVLGLSILALITWVRESLSGLRLFFVVSMSILFVAAVVSGLKEGSAENYFNEFLVLACAAIAYYVDSRNSTEASQTFERGVLQAETITTLICVFLVAFLPFFTAAKLRSYWWMNVVRDAPFMVPAGSLWGGSPRSIARREVVKFLNRNLGRDSTRFALCLDRQLAVQIPGRCLVPQPEIARVLYRRGVLDYARLREDARAADLVYVVHRWGPLPNSFLGLDFTQLKRVVQIGPYTVSEFPRRTP